MSYQIHHIIPTAIAKASDLIQSFLGYDNNNSNNLISLPSNISNNGDALHNGSHPAYSEFVGLVLGRIDEIRKENGSEYGKGVADNIAARQFGNFVDALKVGLQSPGNGAKSLLILSGKDAYQRDPSLYPKGAPDLRKFYGILPNDPIFQDIINDRYPFMALPEWQRGSEPLITPIAPPLPQLPGFMPVYPQPQIETFPISDIGPVNFPGRSTEPLPVEQIYTPVYQPGAIQVFERSPVYEPQPASYSPAYEPGGQYSPGFNAPATPYQMPYVPRASDLLPFYGKSNDIVAQPATEQERSPQPSRDTEIEKGIKDLVLDIPASQYSAPSPSLGDTALIVGGGLAAGGLLLTAPAAFLGLLSLIGTGAFANAAEKGAEPKGEPQGPQPQNSVTLPEIVVNISKPDYQPTAQPSTLPGSTLMPKFDAGAFQPGEKVDWNSATKAQLDPETIKAFEVGMADAQAKLDSQRDERNPDAPAQLAMNVEYVAPPGASAISALLENKFADGEKTLVAQQPEPNFDPNGAGSDPGPVSDYGNTYYDDYSGYEYKIGEPVVLDLTGQGIKLTQRSSSNVYFDMAGDGYQHRTAWAAAGNGVLVIDADGNGKIDQQNEVVFTAWDPTATDDMQALRNVFDSNHNGKLDSGDARWNDFKIMVTNDDGTTTLKTLTELGIQSIDLVPDHKTTVLSDGSTITGTASFTRIDGTKGVAADVSLSFDAQGFAVLQTTTLNADGSVTVDSKARNADGSLANETISITSADGKLKTLRFDHDGDGVIDEVQTTAIVINANGSKTETLINATGAGRIIDKTVTDTSLDTKSHTICRDADGDNKDDQIEAHTTNADGSTLLEITDKNIDGTVKDKSTVATSADGLSKTIKSDVNGDNAWDLTTTDFTVVAGDGSRTQTISDFNNNASLRDRSIVSLSADGRTKISKSDMNGDGKYDLTLTAAIAINADGSSVSTQTDTNYDGSVRDTTTSTVSADSLSKSTTVDVNGDTINDLIVTDVTVVNPDGSRTETITTRNGDSTLRAQSIVTRGADGRSRTVSVDSNGDGHIDQTETIVIANGASVDTVSNFAANGTLINKSIVTTSANGLSKTVQVDINGDETFDETKSYLTVINSNGSSTTTVLDQNANGSVKGKTITTTSADGLSETVQIDLNGDLTIDQTQTDTIVLNADNSKTETLLVASANGTLEAKSITTTSSDRKTITIQRDVNGDTKNDQTETIVTQANGDVVDTVSSYKPDGTLLNKSVVTINATGLTKISQVDQNGDGATDLKTKDVIVLNADGSRTETIENLNTNGGLINKAIITTSATGLSKVTQLYENGDTKLDSTTTDTIVLNDDGSRTETIAIQSYSGALISKTITTISASGLAKTVSIDLNGDGTSDRIATDITVLNADGSHVETIVATNGNGSLRNKSVTTISADGLTQTVASDLDGDGHTDVKYEKMTQANGDRVETVSDLNPNGSLVDMSVITTSANGLVKTIQVDINGNGIIDESKSYVTVVNADGSSTTTVLDQNANGSVKGKTIATTSADGLSATVQIDLNGDLVIDQTQTDTIVLNADGSKAETLLVASANGTLEAKSITTTSADRKTITIQRDVNGDTKIDQTETIVTQANGDVVNTLSSFKPDGTLLNKSTVTVNATGLTKISQVDQNGDGSTDIKTKDVIVLNADGSRTETIENLNANDGLINKAIITTSATGLSKVTQLYVNSDTKLDSTTTDTIVLNDDGSRTETIAIQSYSGALISKTITTISASGLAKTVSIDLNGDGTTDRIATDTTVLNADGSHVETIVATNGNGSLRNKSVTTISADGLTQTILTDLNGDGHDDVKYEKMTQANGDRVETVSDLNPNGSLVDKSVITTSANGLARTVQVDLNGDGTFDQTTIEASVLTSDGSAVKTVTDYYGTVKKAQTISTTSANGLNKTVQIDENGDGTFDLVQTTALVLNGDGSTLETLSEFNANGLLKDKVITTKSTDGKTTTIQRDLNGDAVIDQIETIAVQNNGSTIDTVIDYSAPNVVHDKTVLTTSANGLSTTLQKDDNGDGVFDETQTRTIVLNADGSKTETLTDVNGALHALVAPVGVLTDSDTVVITTSADGLSKTTTTTGYSMNQLLDNTSTDITVLNDDGSRVQTVTIQSIYGFTNKTVTSASADGLTKTVKMDLDGNGTFERKDEIVTGTDGSQVETLTDYNSNGTLERRDVLTTSADGRIQLLQRDANGDGFVDHSESTQINTDGSKAFTVWNVTATGVLIDKTVTTTSANGLSSTILVDSNGDGVVDFSRTNVTLLNADGTVTKTISDLNSNGSLRDKSIVTTSANGLVITTQSDVDGNGVIDETLTDTTLLNVDGSTTRSVIGLYADGSLQSKTITNVSSDDRTITTQRDLDGNGYDDLVTTNVIASDGSKTTTISNKNASGVLVSKTTTSTSADGRISISYHDTNGDGVSDLREAYFQTAHANGSYQHSLQNMYTGYFVQQVDHIIDNNGNEQISNWEGPYNTTIRTDTAQKERDWAEMSRIYDVMLDRDMRIMEGETITKYETATGFNATQLINDIMATTEWTTKYGAVSKTNFVERLYQNAFGRAPSISELADVLVRLNAGTATFASVALTISEGAEHQANGNTHTITNNSSQIPNNYTLDHTIDKAEAAAIVTRLYDAILNHAPDSSSLTANVQTLLSGAKTIAQVANDLLTSTEFVAKYGALTNAGFVTEIYVNTLGRLPSAGEVTTWSGLLTNNTISRAEMVAAFSESSDHRNTGTNYFDPRADQFIGTNGNDSYLIDFFGDSISEEINAGYDTVSTNLKTYTLPENVEKLVYTGSVAFIGIGNEVNNSITGGIAADTLSGGGGNDILDGGLGADRLTGGTGDDTFIVDNAGDVVVEALGEGNDTVRTSLSSYNLAANVENLIFTGTVAASGSGNELNNALTGGTANDTLYGYAGNDTLSGALGIDTMDGGAGSDRYVWLKGNGADIISDSSTSLTETDTLALNDVASTGVTLARSGYNLLVTVTATGEVITVTNRLYSASYGFGIEQISFSDGVTWNLTDILARTATNGTANADTLYGSDYADNLYGLAGNDTLNGYAGNDILNGGLGIDTMDGGAGNDRYVWLKGNGADIISDSSTSLTETDTLALNDVASTGVTLTRSGYNLLVTVTATGEVITVTNRLYSASYGFGIEQISFSDGVTWNLTDILAKTATNGTANADTLYGSDYADNLYGLAGADALYGYAGNDNLTGGLGIDTMDGGAGNDRYVWQTGDGSDIISDSSTLLTETDTLALSNVASTGVALTRSGNNLLVTVAATGEVITVNNRLYSTSYGFGIEQISFSDGVTWNLTDILAKTATNGTANADTLTGTDYADNLYGLAGNDTLNGGVGNDTLNGGAGNDTLNGGAGADIYVYSAAGFGKDIITDFWAGAGITDVLQFSAGTFASWQAVLSASTQVGADTIISLNANDTITLRNVALTNFNADDVRFIA